MGRSGGLPRAHLFYSKRKKKVAVEIKDFCDEENCLRRGILRAIGDTAAVDSSSAPCCSNCPLSRLSLPSKLEIIESTPPVVPVSNKRSAHWKTNKTVDEMLRNRLLEEKQKYVFDHPMFAMIGETAVCPNCKICKEARFLWTKEDISNIVGLRPELQDTFLTVVLDVLSHNPISR